MGLGKITPGERKTKTITGVFGHPEYLSVNQFINNINLLDECVCNISNAPSFYMSVYIYTHKCT